jgi:hypothetical protein
MTADLTFDPDGDLVLVLSNSIENEQQLMPMASSSTPSSKEDEVFLTPATSLSDTGTGDHEQTESTTTNGVRMLVSSKHMKVTSPIFRAILQDGNFKEGQG